MELSLFDEDARGAVALAVEFARLREHARTERRHLLLALASDPKTRTAGLLAEAGIDADTIDTELGRHKPVGPVPDGDPPLSPDLQRILDLAPREAARLTEARTRPEHLLLAMPAFDSGESILDSFAHGGLRETITTERGADLGKPGLRDRLVRAPGDYAQVSDNLRHYTTDLSERPRNLITPIARDAEIERAAQVLARKNRSSPVLVGRPGVGTSAIITGLALLARDTIGRPTRAGMIRSLDWELLDRSGHPDTVERIFREAASLRGFVLCVDNAAERLDLGPGPGTVGEWLWPLTAKSGLRLVLAMTPGELAALNARGSRLESLCQPMTIAEPNVDRATAMITAGLHGLESEYRLRITQEAAAATVALADRYVTDALLPLKAAHILTEACAAVARTQRLTPVVDVAAVTRAVADWTGLPADEITAPEPAPHVVAAAPTVSGSRLPLPAQSTALLIGTATYDDPGIPDIRSISGNLNDLRAALTHDRTGGFAASRTHVFADADDSLRPRVAELAAEARDTLLLYFGGHGWVDPDGRLYLGLRTTESALRRYTSLPYEDLRSMVIDSPARRKLVVLDCCFSGRAIDMLGDGEDTAGQLDISGTYVCTATSATRMAHAPDGARNSAFTEALLGVLRDGVEHGGELIRVADVFPQVRSRLAAKGLPEPQQRGTNTIGELAIARNPRHRG